ncbi:MAG: HigA family addiction module antidote protein [Microbacteriaceae bacterium]|nr:HigA family addiction module antidote protein [Microbacteriaceae bacterium]
MKKVEKLASIRPGEVLLEDFIVPLGITQNRLAVAIGVPPRRINEIVHGLRRITADTALRLAKYFGTSAQFWINLQSHYDLEIEAEAIASTLEGIRPLGSDLAEASPSRSRGVAGFAQRSR